MIFIIIFYDVYITIIKSVLLKRYGMGRTVSENDVLDLEVGEESETCTKWKQSQAKTKRFFRTLENNDHNENSL